MAVAIDYDTARDSLHRALADAEAALATDRAFIDDDQITDALALLFRSKTQAFREALIGVTLIRLQAPSADLAKPYANMGGDAYNARTLDEAVINPFLKAQEIPSSGSPYLSVLRRSRQFRTDHAQGVRDKPAFLALVSLVATLQSADAGMADRLLRQVLIEFLRMRDAANVAVVQLNRISLPQLRALISRFLAVRSGGLIPLITVACALEAIGVALDLDWTVEAQGINAADAASGASGDITVLRSGELHLSIEVTERPVDGRRIISTFRAKIVPHAIRDYLFMTNAAEPDEEAIKVAASYFTQGHEINFLSIEAWLFNNLATIGGPGRERFLALMAERLRRHDVTAVIRVKWNDLIRSIVN